MSYPNINIRKAGSHPMIPWTHASKSNTHKRGCPEQKQHPQTWLSRARATTTGVAVPCKSNTHNRGCPQQEQHPQTWLSRARAAPTNVAGIRRRCYFDAAELPRLRAGAVAATHTGVATGRRAGAGQHGAGAMLAWPSRVASRLPGTHLVGGTVDGAVGSATG